VRKELGSRIARTAIDNTGRNPYGNGLWVGTVDPVIWVYGTNPFEIYHISVRGPVGSTLEVWIDQTFYSATPRGDINEYDPTHPIQMNGGQTLYFFWNVGGATSPLVTVWAREPAVL
jgi:hypothetical protein